LDKKTSKLIAKWAYAQREEEAPPPPAAAAKRVRACGTSANSQPVVGDWRVRAAERAVEDG
jgi:hypothetical protein